MALPSQSLQVGPDRVLQDFLELSSHVLDLSLRVFVGRQ